MSFVTVGMVLPEAGGETSWTPVGRKEYIENMKMGRDVVESQIEADAHRIDLQIRENDSNSVRVHDGRVFHQLLRNVAPNYCDEAIACCTQTVMAQPMVALHQILPDDYIVMNTKEPLRVRVQVLPRRIRVRSSKVLSIVRQAAANSFVPIRRVRIVVEYDSGIDVVFVGIA